MKSPEYLPTGFINFNVFLQGQNTSQVGYDMKITSQKLALHHSSKILLLPPPREIRLDRIRKE